MKEKKDIIDFKGFRGGGYDNLIPKGQIFDKWNLSWI